MGVKRDEYKVGGFKCALKHISFGLGAELEPLRDSGESAHH